MEWAWRPPDRDATPSHPRPNTATLIMDDGSGMDNRTDSGMKMKQSEMSKSDTSKSDMSEGPVFVGEETRSWALAGEQPNSICSGHSA